MAKERVEDKVIPLAEPIAADLQMELVDVEFLKEGGEWILRVYIDKEGGIELDDCALFSHRMSDALDTIDPIAQAYHLEVSSPGLERPLKKEADFERFAGRRVLVHTYAPIDGKKSFEGELIRLTPEGVIELKGPQGTLSIPRSQASLVRLTVEF